MISSFLKYLSYEKRYSPHTVKSYETDLTQFESFLVENYPEVSIEFADFKLIRSWIVFLVDQKIESRSVNRKIASLRAFYKFLLKREVISKDPIHKVRTLKSPHQLPSFVKEKDMSLLLDQVSYSQDFYGYRDKIIIELLYGTGIRLSELISIKDEDISLYDGTLKVLGKRNKERIIPIPKSVIRDVEFYKKMKFEVFGHNSMGSLLVTDSGEKCYPMMIYRVVRKYLGSYTSSEKKSPHVLRHTFATHLLNKGAELNAVKELLGHSSLAATQVYTHNTLDKLKSVFDQAHPKA
jgi:integrase/recombinase XerC